MFFSNIFIKGLVKYEYLPQYSKKQHFKEFYSTSPTSLSVLHYHLSERIFC